MAIQTAISALNILQQYQAIGTVEECREAVEKQKAKIPDVSGDGYFEGQIVYDTYECPNCGKSYEIEYDYYYYKYCPECGQAMDRSGLE